MFKKAGKDAWNVVKRGNMFMLAIGLLLGAAFNEVVKSLANDVIMAAIANTFKVDSVADLKVGAVLIGKFLAALISFLIVALIVFITLWAIFLVRNIVVAKKATKKSQTPSVTPQPDTQELILAELRKLNQHWQQTQTIQPDAETK
ncbi:large conductance mechanosensitive channel protein MscL [Mycoplasmopsis columbinasalis]|uniref:Large conductance mechanosensitive channel protein n=1 Tax=Mycoplasmopsis columbinasalis TaxID=114880 RepID=A0A449BBD4_9BACT|nr:MscL family protein [Mycoplasmopsis columbinasalis]VEU78352.1 large conductance mechanosensitive channel protein [Mycoplasmopsis columbinasalis]